MAQHIKRSSTLQTDGLLLLDESDLRSFRQNPDLQTVLFDVGPAGAVLVEEAEASTVVTSGLGEEDSVSTHMNFSVVEVGCYAYSIKGLGWRQ